MMPKPHTLTTRIRMMKRSYEETIDLLYNLTPAYSKRGVDAYKPGLDRMYSLCAAMDIDISAQRCIHVAGTNGKGSVCHMLSAALIHSGYTVGLHSSPHVVDFRERFKVNGLLVDKDEIVSLVSCYAHVIPDIKPSFFEFSVALALKVFAQHGTDINVVEVGLGGRLDSTNVLLPEVSVITNIDLEHTAILGDTIEKIASEKGGIIKSGQQVVLGQMHPVAESILTQMALERDCGVYLSREVFPINKAHSRPDMNLEIEFGKGVVPHDFGTSYILNTIGPYQIENLQTALTCLVALEASGGGMSIDRSGLPQALRHFAQISGLLGRAQIISTDPLTILDAMHNAAGVRKTMTYFDDLKGTLHLVLGFSADKDVLEMLKLFPSHSKFYFCEAKTSRAMALNRIESIAVSLGYDAFYIASPSDALSFAQSSASRDDIVLVGGSIFLLEDILNDLK